MVKQRQKWTDSGLTWSLLLRGCVLLAVLCVCAHVYLESMQGGPAAALPPAAVRPAQDQAGTVAQRGTPSRMPEDTRAVKRRVSYVRSQRKEPPARQRDGGDGGGGGDGGNTVDHPFTCCPPLRPHRKSLRWHIDLEPWASESHSLEDEARRFLHHITTPQVSCQPPASGDSPIHGGLQGAWAVCLDPKYSLSPRVRSKHCRVYSLGLGVDDRSLERSLVRAGCEVHCFDPSLKQPHLQQAHMWLHRLSVDWRDPNPAVAAQHQHASTKKLAAILNDFGHREVDVLKADMESAEWKILENLVLEGVLDSVGQLLLELHLHWAGFEVGGDDPSVVRYWFSLLKELERANFRLFHSHNDPSKPHLFLHKNILNASSTYNLGWVNTRWKP